MEKINFVTFDVLKTTAWSSCASSVALFNNFTSIFLCLLTTIWSVSLSLLCRSYRWVSQYNSSHQKISARGMMGRGREGKGGSLVSSLTPSHRPPRPSFFPSSQSPYDTKGSRRRGELTSDYFFVLRYTMYHLSTLTPLSHYVSALLACLSGLCWGLNNSVLTLVCCLL